MSGVITGSVAEIAVAAAELVCLERVGGVPPVAGCRSPEYPAVCLCIAACLSISSPVTFGGELNGVIVLGALD